MTAFARDFKQKTRSRAEPIMEDVSVPAWITKTSKFPESILSEMLTIPSGSSYGHFLKHADPFGTSTASVSRAIEDLVRGWLTENLTDMSSLEPEDYLFDSTEREPAQTSWLSSLLSIEVRENEGFTMEGGE